MKIILLSFLPIFIANLFMSPVFASTNLEISTSNNFASTTLNFNSGQTIFVRISSEITNAKEHVLNVRDNQYNIIKSYDLIANNSVFSASFNAPANEGYYSLEAKIEAEGAINTSVKTIKVGSPNNSNINVSIQNSVNGNKVLGANSKSKSEYSATENTNNNNSEYEHYYAAKSDETKNVNNKSTINPDTTTQNNSVVYKIKTFCLDIISNIWPF